MTGSEPSVVAAPLEEKIARDGDWSTVSLAPDDEVDVMIHAHAGAGDAAAASVASLGGSVGSNYSDVVHATIRADRIDALASASGVRRIEERADPRPHLTSEGVATTHADQLHNLGLEGKGVTVAVIDLRFNPDQNEITDQVVGQIGDSSNFQSGTPGLHGTACAEVVAEMAPKADIVLASVQGTPFTSIMDDITSQFDPDVMSMSLGYKPTYRLDGEDPFSSRITDYTSALGANTSEGGLFCVSAGNEAYESHWDAPWQDAGSGYMDFGGGDEFFQIDVGSAFSTQEAVVQSDADWSTSADYVLELYDSNKNYIKNASSTTPAVSITLPTGTTSYLKIKDDGLDGTEHFDIFTWGNFVTFPTYTSERSLGIPATSPDSLTLSTAAVRHNSDDLEYFSSRGPTQDGRRGVDIAAPDGTLSDVYDDDSEPGNEFYGTSSACPHAAGAAALLSEFSTVENHDVRDALFAMARDITGDESLTGNPVPPPTNRLIGHGYVELNGALDELVGLVRKATLDPANGRAQFASPAVDADRVYAGGLGEDLVTYTRNDASDWSYTRAGALSDSSPVVAGNRVFVGGGGGYLYALDDATGSTAWFQQFDSAVTSTPAFASDTVYFATNDGTVRAADDTSNGSILWSEDVGGPVFSDLAFSGGRLYVTTDDGDLVCLDTTSNGAEHWRFDTGTDLGASSPTVAGGSVFVAADRVYAFDDAATETPQWDRPYGGTAGSSPAYSNDVVFVGSADGNLYAFDDAASGSQLWSKSTGDAIAASPAATGDRVIVPSMDGNLYVYLEDGTEIGSTALPSASRSSPVVDDNDVYLGTRDGKLLRH